jgi:Putative zinc ribbon domain.
MVKGAKYKPVQCPECGKWLKSAQGLGGHTRLKHGHRKMTKAGVLSQPGPALVKVIAGSCAKCGQPVQLLWYDQWRKGESHKTVYYCEHCDEAGTATIELAGRDSSELERTPGEAAVSGYTGRGEPGRG